MEEKISILDMGAEKIAEIKSQKANSTQSSGRKKALFNTKILGVRNRNEIIKATAEYYYKTVCGKEEYTDRELNKIANTLEALICVSSEGYHTKVSISNECIEDIINNDNNMVDHFNKYLKDVYGYIYDTPVEDIIYYFTWFAVQKTLDLELSDPPYTHIADRINKEKENE